MKHILTAPLVLLAAVCMPAATRGATLDPTRTSYSMTECEGSLTPYPEDLKSTACPDSLVPVFINHVGRHGARYPASAANCRKLGVLLQRADSLGTITPTGRRLAALNSEVEALSRGRWGALDSLGMAEQRGIAARMYKNFRPVFKAGEDEDAEPEVKALSSYSPRAMMSMYCFLHQLDRLDNKIEFTATTGRVNSPLMRPFDLDKDYLEFRAKNVWKPAYDTYFASACPTTAIRRVLGDNFPFATEADARDAAITEYYVVAGLRAMGLPSAMEEYFTVDEANALWSCFNLRQYLQRTATSVSSVPADIAGALVEDIIATTDDFVAGKAGNTRAVLRFGHAETLMPLLSLLRIPGCYYLTNYFDTVGANWRDFYVVPMAANVQFILFRAKASGRYYVRVDLNETPVKLRKGDDAVYFPWGELRRYMSNCLPMSVDL